MRLLIDNQLPLRLAIHLRARGHDCVHVLDVGLSQARDLELWDRAVREDRVLVSKDEDFTFLASRPGDQGRLIWVRLGNCRNPALLDAFDQVLGTLASAFAGGQRVIEIQ